MTERKCYCCKKGMPKGTEHVEYDGKLYCMDCIEENTVTHYFVGGEHLGTDDDGVVKVYAWEDEDAPITKRPHQNNKRYTPRAQ